MFGLGHYIYAGESVPENAPITPTKEELATMTAYKNNEDSLRFFLFAKHLGDDKYTSFYNSAPKDKMKFKAACDELEKKGQMDSQCIVSDVKDLLDDNDPAWQEHLEGLEKSEKAVIWGLFDKETQELMKNFKD